MKNNKVFEIVNTQEEFDTFQKSTHLCAGSNKSYLLLFSKKENCKLTKAMREVIVELAKTYDFQVVEVIGQTDFCLHLKKNMSVGLYPTLIIFKESKNYSAIAEHYKIKNLGDIHQGESIEIKRFIDTCSKSMLTTQLLRVFPRRQKC